MKKDKAVALGCLIGATLEWYDFALFGMLLPVIAINFFPNDNSTSLLKTLFIFTSAFLTRPFGALFWGYYGDKKGRKNIILITITLMTCSTVAIGLLPTYQAAGAISIVLLIFFRLLQGFSASGEHAAVLTHLYEIAPKKNKGLYATINITSVYLGISLAVLVNLLLILAPKDNLFISWRSAFIASFVLGIVSYFLRMRLTESSVFLRTTSNSTKYTTRSWLTQLKNNARKIICGIGIFQLATIVPYIVFFYVVSFTVHQNSLSQFSIYTITLVNALTTAALVPIFAILYQKTDNIKIPLLSILCLFIGAIPVYSLFFTHNLFHYWLAQIYFCVLTAMLVGPFCLIYAKQFTAQIRFSAIAICFNFAASLFAGLSPLIISTFQLTHFPVILTGVYMMCSCACALFALLSLTQTKLHRRKTIQCQMHSLGST